MRIDLEHGADTLALRVPDGADVLTLPAVTPLADPGAALRQGLADPLGAPALAELVRAKAAADGNRSAPAWSVSTPRTYSTAPP